MQWLLLISIFCGANAWADPVWIDEVAYYSALKQSRPDLIKDPNICYSALVLKVELRSQLIHGTQTPTEMQSQLYTPEQTATDLAWITSQQKGISALGAAWLNLISRQGHDVHGISANDPSNQAFQRWMDFGLQKGIFRWAPAGYRFNSFVGYRIGSAAGIADSRNLDYKVFFEFKNSSNFTVREYYRFSKALAQVGFNGDSKTVADANLPGQIRFQYNNLIVHSHSIEDAKKAETVGRQIFGEKIAFMSRGVDVLDPGSALDWHHYLCAGKYEQLPDDVKQFVANENEPTTF